jgi:hypothetical protein
LSCYQYLAAAADARHEKLWAIKPKFHYFWHVPPSELEVQWTAIPDRCS